MSRQIKRFAFLSFFLLLAFVGSVISTMMTSDHKSFLYRLELVLTVVCILLFWPMLYHLIRIVFFRPYEEKYGRKVPYLFITIARALCGMGAFLSFVVFVLHQSIFSFMTVGGLVSAGLTFALGALILDLFSGIVHEVERPFAVGDWIRLAEGEIEGEIKEINLRTVILETEDDILHIVPHGKLAQGFSNLSRPEKAVWETLTVSLDHSVAVDRAERLLFSAALRVPGVDDGQVQVFADRFDVAGIIYLIRYRIPEMSYSSKTRHNMILSVTHHLHQHKIKISQFIGDMDHDFSEKPYVEAKFISIEELIKHLPLFQNLSSDLKKVLTSHAIYHYYIKGEKVVEQDDLGDSLFILAEGAVDVFLRGVNADADNMSEKIKTLYDPSYFGEMSLLLGQPRSATVVTACNCVIYEIKQQDVLSVLKEQPMLFETMKKEATDRLSQNAEVVDKISKTTAHHAQKKMSWFERIESWL